ncbi:MAG: class I SAM-dependent methyltransferase [Deltaproteobacteria bacterium]|nr:class I SAM-dependent methyltransferase [Deltaproteobacteria bacterium]MBW2139028.1 class I SAM-dependent methyltransferase [Deltaproteobacteria bacterium]
MEKIPELFAAIYEKATRLVVETYYTEVADEVVSHLKSGLILDLGTGPGYLPIQIAKRAAGISIRGVDLSKRLIRMAQLNALGEGLDNRVRFEIGNASNLRFEDETFDMVLSTGMLHMVKDPVKMLRESYRVLKQGAEAWFYDPAQVSSRANSKKWKESFGLRERMIYALFPLYQRINPSHSYTRTEIDKIISATPFNLTEIEQKGKEFKIKLRKE